MQPTLRVGRTLLLAIALTAAAATRAGEPGATAPYLADRGDGIPTSLFGTYIREKEFIFYPFFEYSRYKKFEYAPKDFGLRGLGEDDEFFGQAFEREALIFMAYAFTDSLALEFESALYSTIDFRKSPNDSSAVPGRLRESGLGDTEINIRYRYLKETATRPEVTFFFKTAFPLQKRKKLLGTQHWEFSPGVVLTKGFSWGTVALRASMAADSDERKLEFSEYAIDYIKRLSDNWRIVLSLEGEQDEASVIGELQYRLGKNAVLKINSGFGLTKKAANFAPEIGILFRF